MNAALFAVTAAVLAGILLTDIIITISVGMKSRRYKKRIPIKDADPKRIGIGFVLFVLIAVLILTLYPLYKYSDHYDFTERIETYFRAACYGLAALDLLVEILFGAKAYITEDGILTKAAFYPKGEAKYEIEKNESEIYILLYTKKVKHDFAFIVNPQDESEITSAIDGLYEKFDGTAPKLKKQSYMKRNLVIRICSVLVFTGGLSLWFTAAKPVIFVGDKIVKTNSELALFSHFGYYELFRGNNLEYYGELGEKAEEWYSYVDYTDDLTSKDMAALKEMPNLKHLDVTINNIDDLTEIGKLTQLEGLAFGGGIFYKKPTDYLPLKNLTNLKFFSGLGLTNLNDLTVFENADGLIYFELTDADIQSGLSAVCEKENLATLNLFKCTAEDFSPIGKCAKLKKLTLSRTNVTDLDFLKNLTELEYLDIDDTSAEDYSVLLELPSLERLTAKNCNIPEEIISVLTEKGVEIYN